MFGDLEEIGGVYNVKKFKQTDMIKRPYPCHIAVYQLAMLQT